MTETLHAIFLERYKARLVRRVLDLIKPLGPELAGIVSERELQDMDRRALADLQQRIKRAIARGYDAARSAVLDELQDLSAHEGRWAADNLQAQGVTEALGIPSDNDLWAAVESRPFEGRLLRDWTDKMGEGLADRVARAIAQGYADGRGSIDIAREIRGTRNVAGIVEASRRGAEMLVRTAVAHTANAARERTYQANKDVMRGVMWMAVLDTRTTAICAARDGEIYPVNEGPRPPAHIGCRSTMAALTRMNLARMKERTTYQQWLKAQAADVQDDVLGKTKGKLFRVGGLTVDRFVDASGKEYTLEELKAQDAAAFKRATGE